MLIPRSAPRPALRDARGLTLIEILVVLVITAIGMLGLAGLMVKTVSYNQTAYLRSAATQMAGDLGDRMRANYIAAVYDTNLPYQQAATYAAIAGTASFSPVVCAPCTDAQKAANDLALWNTQVRNQLPGGAGAVLAFPNGRYQVVVMWRERQSDNPSAADVTLWGTSGCPAAVDAVVAASAVPGVRCFVTELRP
jgi:type IV pilus assembly protein PilV